MSARSIALGLFLTGIVPTTEPLAQDETNAFRLRQHQIAAQNSNDADLQAEIDFGRTIAARVLGQMPLHQDDALSTYVNLVGHALIRQANRPELEFHFAVLGVDFINAYSAPGGYVFITRGALQAMRDEAELAAVLAHEIGHITEKHIVKEHNIRGRDTSALSTVSSIVGGAQDSARVAALQAVDKAVTMLLTTGPKHEDELAADETALLLLASTGYDPQALHRFLARIGTLETEPQNTLRVSHPPATDRILNLERLLRENGLNQTRYAQVKERFQKNVRIQP